jgi:hypothetical protein
MSNHTGTARACQYHARIPRPETTLPPLDGIDRRLVQRYGAWLLTGGYTALPTYAWVYYARLGVTEAEMVCIAQLCTYWWSARAPFPGEAALAARMGKSVRTIQGYLRSLEGKGLLHIQTQFSPHGRQSTNAYDLRPFFTAVEGLARLDGLLPADDAAPATPATLDNGSCHRPQVAGDNDSCKIGPFDHNKDMQGDAEQRLLCAGATCVGTENRHKDTGTPATEEGEGSRAGGVKNPSPQVNPIEVETFDFDSTPPTPPHAAQTTTGGDDRRRRPASADPDDQALAAEIAALSAALGDDAPRSSLGRARNLCRAAGVSPARFLRLLDEAATRTRDRQASIVKRRRDDQAPNGMPYLFAVLTDLLHPAPLRTRAGSPDADRRRAGPTSRRRRRADDRGEPANSYAAWSDSPAPLPITEEHPVWRAVLDELAQVLTPENFNAWLAATCALDQDGELLRVAVPTPFNKTWLEQKLAGKVAGALHKIDATARDAARVVRVEYVVAAAA